MNLSNKLNSGLGQTPDASSVRADGAPGASQADVAADAAAGAAFRALLERLERSAKELDEASASIEDPRELGQAVENARASVEEAVVAGGDLLEAYRAAKARAAAGAQGTNTQEPESRPSTGQGAKR